MSAGYSQLLRFGVVGFAVAVIYITLFTLLYHSGLIPFAANAIAFSTSVVVQYLGQTCWTFRRPLWDGQQSARFFATIGLGMVYSSLVASIIGPALDWRPWIAAGMVAVTLPVINYISFRLWVYGPEAVREDT